MPDDKITRALSIILNKANHPILIHCNKGKVCFLFRHPCRDSFLTFATQHRTGCVVGCLRRFQGWTVPLAIEEYRKYASIKSRQRDMAKIENYSLQHCWEIAKDNDWIPTTVNLEEEMEVEPPLLVAAPAAIKAQ